MFERDVDLRGEVVSDLPVALRAHGFPDFEPDALPLHHFSATAKTADSDRRQTSVPPPSTIVIDTVNSAAGQGHSPDIFNIHSMEQRTFSDKVFDSGRPGSSLYDQRGSASAAADERHSNTSRDRRRLFDSAHQQVRRTGEVYAMAS